MDTPGVYYRQAMDEIDAFWRNLEGFGYFDNNRDLWIEELKQKGNYENPQVYWKQIQEPAKQASRKMVRTRTYLYEDLGLPPNVADKIARQTVFGKNNKLRLVESDIVYLSKK